jgi:hypothetical protein
MSGDKRPEPIRESTRRQIEGELRKVGLSKEQANNLVGKSIERIHKGDAQQKGSGK